MDTHLEKRNERTAAVLTFFLFSSLLIFFMSLRFDLSSPVGNNAKQGSLEMELSNMSRAGNAALVSKPVQKETKIQRTSASRNVHLVSSKDEQVAVRKSVSPHDQQLVEAVGKIAHGRSSTRSGDMGKDNTGLSAARSEQGKFSDTTGNIIYVLNTNDRRMTARPDIHDDSQETGIVAVEITIDKYGKVIKAEPILSGSTTISSVLWKKTKQGLLNQTLFNQSPSGEEARGTIYINFTVR